MCVPIRLKRNLTANGNHASVGDIAGIDFINIGSKLTPEFFCFQMKALLN